MESHRVSRLAALQRGAAVAGRLAPLQRREHPRYRVTAREDRRASFGQARVRQWSPRSHSATPDCVRGGPQRLSSGGGDIIDYAPYGTVSQECVRARIARPSLPNAGPARWITGCRPRRSTRRGRTASSSSCGVSPWTGTCSSSRCYTRTAPFRLVASEWPSAPAPSLLPAPAHMQ